MSCDSDARGAAREEPCAEVLERVEIWDYTREEEYWIKEARMMNDASPRFYNNSEILQTSITFHLD